MESQVKASQVQLPAQELKASEVMDFKADLPKVDESKRPKPVVLDTEEERRRKWVLYDNKVAKFNLLKRLRDAKGTYVDKETQETVVVAGNLYIPEMKELQNEINGLAKELNG